MAFNAAVFWPALKRAGMLGEATHQPADGPVISFDVGFARPDQVVLDGVVHSTDYSIEYQSADIELKRGNAVQIAGEGQFTVRQTPMAKGDGTFVVASLEKVGP
jgi:hypothetical protein